MPLYNNILTLLQDEAKGHMDSVFFERMCALSLPDINQIIRESITEKKLTVDSWKKIYAILVTATLFRPLAAYVAIVIRELTGVTDEKTKKETK